MTWQLAVATPPHQRAAISLIFSWHSTRPAAVPNGRCCRRASVINEIVRRLTYVRLRVRVLCIHNLASVCDGSSFLHPLCFFAISLITKYFSTFNYSGEFLSSCRKMTAKSRLSKYDFVDHSKMTAPLKLRPYGAIQICLLLLLLQR